ncbi:nucleotidyltransferase [Novosphingobium terrae]|uniref:nucleotidyltransferase n=1 Tax=Novosphingobium terrae TaxID=2726189 RepID=UPI00197EA8B8|nr:nucleotidyltransferase [Novosphingobium terrae]
MTTSTADRLIKDLAKSLEVPDSRYESTDRSYRSLARWLEREGSLFHHVETDVYVQGSFRLGTAIRPVGGAEHYDLDVVCEFSISKAHKTQSQLHADLGRELAAYAEAKGMDDPSSWDRCWTLNYADEARFHMDVLPCVPDGKAQRQILEARLLSTTYVNEAVAITDSNHVNFSRISNDWPASNPNGYAAWFKGRMRVAFERRRQAIALVESANVNDIPTFRVKTPLQSAIQILKRHRDVRFSDEGSGRPSSIIITTLAAHAYGQEADILGALLSILKRMDGFIEDRSGEWWISNPSDPRENFADYWNTEPKLKDAFDDWLETARTDFQLAAEADDPQAIVDLLSPRLGRVLVEEAASLSAKKVEESAGVLSRISGALRQVLDAPHRRPARWPVVKSGKVEIRSALFTHPKFRKTPLLSDGRNVAAGGSLRFEATTDVPEPYQVFWQVVNTGGSAAKAGALRGRFEEASSAQGRLVRRENTLYPGSHSIECFIVKEGYCVARSGPFVVNVA